MRPDIQTMSQRLRQASDPAAKLDALLAELAPMGVAYAFYGCGTIGDALPLAQAITVRTNLPAAFMIDYQAENMVEDDWLVHHCLTSDRPARWHDRIAIQRTPVRCHRVHELAWDHGLTNGIMFPTRNPANGISGGLSLVAPELPEKDFGWWTSRYRSRLHLLAMIFHSEMQKSMDKTAPPSLTAREQECLLWITTGLNARETADRMGVSTRTVEHHLENARRKLDARNRIHCVARAVSLGLIEL